MLFKERERFEEIADSVLVAGLEPDKKVFFEICESYIIVVD
jgi:hypothetical protein